jgi:hypothetical protein
VPRVCPVEESLFLIFMEIQGHFTLRPSVERTRDSSNLIGGEQKFVRLAFTLKANGPVPPKRLHGSTFWKFWHQNFVQWRKTCLRYLWKPKLSSSGQTFLSTFKQSLQFIYFYGLLPCPLEGSLSEVLSTQHA